MANIPIRSITLTGTPTASSKIVFDDGQMKAGLVSDLADGVRPVASQAEAQAGVDNVKTMTALRTSQYVSAQIGVSLASKAQGDIANTALQPGDIGSTVQAYDADLTAIAGLTSAADKLPYFTGVGTAALADLSAFGRSLVDDTDATAARTTLGVVIGTDVQAYDAQLSDIAGITYAQGDILYHNGTGLAALAPGATGQVLRTQGAAANPVWSDAAGLGDMLAATYDPGNIAANAFNGYPVTNRTALKALDTSEFTTVYLTESGREGQFVWKSGDYSAEVASDTLEGIYIKADAIAATAGAWVRQGDWAINGADARWWGLVADYDPVLKTGTSIHTPINAAFAIINWLKLPVGNMLISDQITMSGAKRLSGAGRRLTSIYANAATFNMAATGWVVFTGGEALHELHGISFFAQDQPDSAVLADYVEYPPVIHAFSQPRFNIHDIRLQEVYTGIDMRGNSGGAVLDDIELAMFFRGIQIDGSVDSVKLTRIHLWPFGFAAVTNKRSVYHAARGIETLRCDDLHLSNSLMFGCANALHADSGATGSTFGSLNSVDFDASGGLHNVTGNLHASNCVFTLGVTNSQLLVNVNGKMTVSASYFFVAAVSTLGGSIDILNGDVVFSGCMFDGGSADNRIFRIVNTASATITGCKFNRTTTATFTREAIEANGADVRLILVGNHANAMTTGSSEFVSTTAAVSGEISGNFTPGWTHDVPSTSPVGFDGWRSYTPAVTPTSGAITTVGALACRYKKVGKTVVVNFDITITDNGTGSGALRVTLPAAGASPPVSSSVGSSRNTSGGQTGIIFVSGSNSYVEVFKYDNTYPVASGQRIVGSIEYEVA